MRRSLYAQVKAVRAVNSTAVSGNGNTDGTAVGLDQAGADFRTASVVLLAGVLTDGTYTAVPQESANGSTGWTNVPADRLQGSAVVDASHEVAELGVIPDPGVAPFLRVRVTATAVTTGGSVAAVLLLGSPSSTPIAR
jgi:hypothetical protein